MTDTMDVMVAVDGVPMPGQLVTVRNRHWVAADIVRGSVTSVDPELFTARPEHLVTLVSVEDDARDEELRVVWELEPGTVVHESTTLPSPENGFDEPSRLAAFLHAVRWGAIASADKTALQAPFRSGIRIEDYQLDPVVRALSMPRTNLLIADDVGLGKTIEAGLVMQELMLRHRARTMLIVCPAGLTIQWRDEMRDKFGLDFRIVDADLLKSLRRSRGSTTNPWAHYPRLIVSVDWLKRDRPMRLLREILPPVPRYPRALDLLVVDEVHTCAPSGRGRYAVDSLRTKAIREVAPHCEHRLFLSATPHNGYLESFTALLELLDNQRFARGVRPADDQLARIMVRRMKKSIPPRWDGTPRFGTRDLDYVEVAYSPDEQRAHEVLAAYSARRRASAAGNAQRVASDFVTTLLKRRLFSSPKAFANTVTKHLATMTERAYESAPTPQAVLLPLFERVDETVDDTVESAYGDAEFEALSAVRGAVAPLSDDELKMLHDLRDWAAASQDRPEAKFTAMRGWLDPIVQPGGEWNDQRVIVFSEYRDTQRWLFEQLIAAGYPKERIALLYGGQDTDEREYVKNVFTAEPHLDPVRILLATDAASEGINLQAHCHRVLHWEIPWNPNRLEQRNGRVDRHGQRAQQVEVRHFVPKGWQAATFDAGSLEDELDFLRVAVEKTEQIREDLGSAGEVISAQVEQKMIGERTEWTTADAEIVRRSSKARLKVERDLAKHLQKLTDALTGSRDEMDLTPSTVERVVRSALILAHRRDLIHAEAPTGFDGRVFRLPELPGAWATARNAGLYHPLTGIERPITFDHEAAAGRSDVVLLHLGHRLVQMCLRLLRAELWSGDSGTAKLHRVTARVVPGDLLRVPAVVAHGRVVITGTQGMRLHEEVIAAGGLIDHGKFVLVRGDEEIAGWLAAASDELAGEAVRDNLAGLWPVVADPLTRALNTRANQRTKKLEGVLEKRCEEEVAAVAEVLAELERSIRATLSEDEHWQQASLFEIDERDQLNADRESLLTRLEMIPDQVRHETDELRRRYAAPKARWFPAAVEFLVPASIARGGY